MTESSNDQALREIPMPKHYVGRLNIYAPHPEPQHPSYQLQHAVSDSINNPNYSQGLNYQPAASALVQHQVFPSYVNTAQTTGPLTNYQEAKQHIVYQHQPDMPMAAYNPTYLVTQSNQLLDQHKQHLFKPDPLFVQHSHKSENQRESEFIPSYQLDQHTTTAPIIHYQNQQISQPLDEPQFARLIAADPNPQQQLQQLNQPNPTTYQNKQKHSSVLQHRPTLTENEMSNLLNFGRLDSDSSPHQNNNNAAGFIASSFIQTQPINTSSGSVLYTNPSFESILQHQQQNNDRIVEATRQVMNNQQQASSYHHNQAKATIGAKQHLIFVTKSPDQKRQDDVHIASVGQSKESNNQPGSDLRIYVPDTPENVI